MGKTEKQPLRQKLGRRSHKDAAPTADELALIALELFANAHYTLVSIKDIGRAANVNSAMIYYHFKDKEDLFRAAIGCAVQEAFDHYDDFLQKHETDGALDSIATWIDVHIQLRGRLRSVVKIGMDCSGLTDSVADALNIVQDFYRHEHNILTDLVSGGIREGTFRNVDVDTVATMISTMLDGALARSLILPDFEFSKTLSEFKGALTFYLSATPGTGTAGQKKIVGNGAGAVQRNVS